MGEKSHTGRHQFERAQDQIGNLQEDNADLNKINDELHEKYVKAATRLDRIDAAKAEEARSEASLASITATSQEPTAPKPQVQLDQPEHHGKLAQPELAATVA